MTELYSRLYWRFRDEFADVYYDDVALATWVRLLIIAEGSYPATSDLPRTVSDEGLQKLIDAQLITLLPGGRFRVESLDKERKRRAEAAKNAANTRWDNAKPMRSHSNRTAKTMPSKAKQSTSKEQATDLEQSGGYTEIDTPAPVPSETIPPDVARLQLVAEELTGRPYVMANVYGGLGLKVVTEQLPHGVNAVERAWRKIAGRTGGRATLRQLVLGADDLLNPIVKPSAQEQRDEEARVAQDRRVERTRRELAQLRGEA